MHKYFQFFFLFIAAILICQLFACSASRSDPNVDDSTRNPAEMSSDEIPHEAMEKVHGLLRKIEAEHNDFGVRLLEEAGEILQLDEDVFVVFSKWENEKKPSYLPVLVSREETDWRAAFLGENTVEFTPDGINRIETGVIRTFTFQGTALSDGFLFYIPGRYMRVVLGAERLSDNIGTEQQSFDLKKADTTGKALWLYAVHNPERPDSVMLLSDGVFASDDQNDLVFLYVKELSESYELTCGDLHVKGSDLLQAIRQETIQEK